jgi:nitrate/nitrite-specific signal transduction histidine kinase
VQCTFTARGNAPIEDREMAAHLYFIAQEAVRNAVQHSSAATIKVTLDTGPRARLTVQDDGTWQEEAAPVGIGLHIMEHRAALISASLNVARGVGQPTTVTCLFSTARN